MLLRISHQIYFQIDFSANQLKILKREKEEKEQINAIKLHCSYLFILEFLHDYFSYMF